MKTKNLFNCLSVIVLLQIFLWTSCASGTNISFNGSEDIQYENITVKNVKVTLDHTPESNLEEQIIRLSQNLLHAAQNKAQDSAEKIRQGKQEGKVYLDIMVNQRSFLKGTSILNGIFFSLSFTDAQTGQQIALINEYYQGKESAVSTFIQEKFLKKAIQQYFKAASEKAK